MCSSSRPRQQQVCCISARDQKNQEYCSQEKPHQGAGRPNGTVWKRLDKGTPPALVSLVELIKVDHDRAHF
jgi:hypothetical protein